MNLVELYNATHTATRLASFIEGGSLAAQLDAIGDTALAAGRDALRRAGEANDPRPQVTAALGPLLQAHHAYRKLYAVHELRDRQWLMRAELADEEVARKDFWTCVWLALCDRYLDEPELMADSLSYAEDALRGFWGAELFDAVAAEWRAMPASERAAISGSHYKLLWRRVKKDPEVGFGFTSDIALSAGRTMLHPFASIRSLTSRSSVPKAPSPTEFVQYMESQQAYLARA
jgi:hypothetical protein